MSQLGLLRQADGRLKAAENELGVIGAKMEDLCFRAQRISRALKAREGVKDTTFASDLVDLRKQVRAFLQAAEGLPSALGAVSRAADVSEPGAAECAASLSGAARRLPQSAEHLHELALLVHRYSPEGEARVTAWYMAQECEGAIAALKPLAAGGAAVLRLYGGD